MFFKRLFRKGGNLLFIFEAIKNLLATLNFTAGAPSSWA
jgi:hypothetical protein